MRQDRETLMAPLILAQASVLNLQRGDDDDGSL